jgi:beta-galactosidase
MREPLGVHYNEFSHLTLPLGIKGFGQKNAGSTHWVDGLIVDDATVMATYDHPFFKDFPAVTTKEFGKGRATYIGTLPNYELSKGISEWVRSLITMRELPYSDSQSVRTNSAITKDGKTIHFIFNWGWEVAKVKLPFTATSLLSKAKVKSLELGAWSFEVIEQE